MSLIHSNASAEQPDAPRRLRSSYQLVDTRYTTELYSHHLSEACWAGARIIMRQTSFKSETIFDLLVASFSSKKDSHKLANLKEHKQRSGVSDEDWQGVLAYAAQVRFDPSRTATLELTSLFRRSSPTSPTSSRLERQSSSLASPSRLSRLWSLLPRGKMSLYPSGTR